MRVHRWAMGWFCLVGAACGAQPLTSLDAGECVLPGDCAPPDDGGANALPGSGWVFVVDALEIGTSYVGFDLDERCDPDCVDNALTVLGRYANPTLQSGLRHASDLLVFEVFGIDEDFAGDDDAVTLAVYRGLDADEDRSNNFDGAGQLLLDRMSLTGDGVARTQVRARISDHRLTTDVPFDTAIAMTLGLTMRPAIPLKRAGVSFDLASDRSRFEAGVLGGAVPAEDLFALEDPFCKTVSPRCPAPIFDPTLLDFVAQTVGSQPDIDLDADGAECVLDGDGDGKLDVCCDAVTGGGCSPTCTNTAPAVDAANPGSCVRHAAMADGYSLGLEVTGVAATIVGIAD